MLCIDTVTVNLSSTAFIHIEGLPTQACLCEKFVSCVSTQMNYKTTYFCFQSKEHFFSCSDLIIVFTCTGTFRLNILIVFRSVFLQAVSATGSFINDSKDLHGIFDTDISRENILNIGSTTGPIFKADCPSQDNGGQGEKPADSLSWINKDGYSTEGTAGSESFGDRDDDIIDRLLVDNIDDLGVDYEKFDVVPDGRKSSLTPLSLETLNSSELDRRECVLSFIQAWSPLNLPSTDTYSNSLPGACADIVPVEPTSSESYDKFPSIYEDSRISPNEPRQLHEVDSQEFILFYQREPEPVSRPLSDGWNLLKNDRAPWINIGSAGSEEVMQGRQGSIGDDQDSGWPNANTDSWQDPNKGLTICSLSTINEESDDADRIDNL